MSVTRVSRKREGMLVVLLASIVTAVAAAAVTPVPVKTTPRNEVGPSASADWFSWSRSRKPGTTPLDLFAQHGTDRAFKVNPNGTQGYGGGIDGTRLLYQLIRGRPARSDLRLFNLQTRRRIALPTGINTSGWECCGTIWGDWILFNRGRAFSRARQLVLLRNLATGEQRVLDTLSNRRGVLTAGQVNGNFAAWSRCDPYPNCVIYRYELTTASATALPTQPGKVLYGVSVNPYGTVYYLRRTKGCGSAVELVKQTTLNLPEVLTSFPPGRDGEVTFAYTVPLKPPSLIVKTQVYYDTVVCRDKTWNIYRVDDHERLLPPTP